RRPRADRRPDRSPTRRSPSTGPATARLHASRSRPHPPRPYPPRHPVRPFWVVGVEPGQLDARTGAVDELALPDVHPHVRHAAAGPRREQEDVPRLERFDDRRHLRARGRLIATHPREADPVLAVGELNQPGAVEAVGGGSAPLIGRADGIQSRVYHLGGAADYLGGNRRRGQRCGRPCPAAAAPPPTTTLGAGPHTAQRQRDAERDAHSFAGPAGLPESTRAAILHAVAGFGTQGEARERTPIEPAPHAPLSAELPTGGIGQEAER